MSMEMKESWERLVHAVLPDGREDDIVTLSKREIYDILSAADEIANYDPTVSRILCEMAYWMTQKLNPYSEEGVCYSSGLQIQERLKFEKIDKIQDMTRLQEFDELYRKKLCEEEEMKLMEFGDRSGNVGNKTRNLATLKALENALKQLNKDISPDEAERIIPIETREQAEEFIHPPPTMVIPRPVPPCQKEFIDLRYQTPLCHCLQNAAVRVIGPSPNNIHEGRLVCICPNVRCDFFAWLSPSKVIFDRSISISKEVTPRFDGLNAKNEEILTICKEMQANVKRNEEFTGKWIFSIIGMIAVIMSCVLLEKLM